MPRACLVAATVLAVLLVGTLAPAAGADAARVLTWSGDVTLDAPFIVREHETLVVEPGTSVRSGALERDFPYDNTTVTGNGGYVLVRGRLIVNGTPEAPVRFFTNVTLDQARESVIRHARFDAADFPFAGRPCALHVRDASPRVEDSWFSNHTSAVCVNGGRPVISGSVFVFNAFKEEAPSTPQTYCVITGSRAVGRDAVPEQDCRRPPGWVAPAGARNGCWESWPGHWFCRGWGGVRAAVTVEAGDAVVEDNHFEANYAGVFVSARASAVLRGNAFVDNANAGVDLDAYRADQDPHRRVIVEGNDFTGHGVVHPLPVNPGYWGPAGLRMGAGNLGPVGEGLTMTGAFVVRGNAFHGNGIGAYVGGDVRNVRFEENAFHGNVVGFSNHNGYAILDSCRFDSILWDLYLAGGYGSVQLVNTTFDPEKVKLHGEAEVWWEGGVIRQVTLGAAIASAFALAAAALTEAGRWVLGKSLLAVGYARITRGKLLEHGTRAALLARVKAEPGVHLRALARDAGSYGVAVHHLTRLESEGFVRSARDGVRRRFYPAGAAPADAPLAPLARKLLALARERPGVGVSEAARALACSKQLASYHARVLQERGLVRVEAAPRGGRALVAVDAPRAGDP